MRLVTYQPLNTDQLKTGIQINQYDVLDVAIEAAARGSEAKVATMLDIIEGGSETLALLKEIAAASIAAGCFSNCARQSVTAFTRVSSSSRLLLRFSRV